MAQALQSGALDDDEATAAIYDWAAFWARDNQLAPPGDWLTWLLLAGRGFGKTRTVCEWLRGKAEAGIGPLAIVGRTSADVRDVLIEGPAGILAVSPPSCKPVWEPSKRRLTWPNGVTATTFSAEQPDQLRGPQHAAAIADEIAAWQYYEETWSNLLFGLRLGANPQVAAATTPRPLPMIRDLLRDPDCVATRGKTRDNADNLSPKAVALLEKRYAGTRLGRQELDGEVLDDLAGALWTRAMLDAATTAWKVWGSPFEASAFRRIVVGVDPSGSAGKNTDAGDAIGIIVAGELPDGRFVVLEDLTCHERPEEWAKRVVAAWSRWQADMIVAETNYGGDMVRAVIQANTPAAPVAVVTASRGKHVRAEPISALYEQGRVAHALSPLAHQTDSAGDPFAARGFAPLEDELTQFTAGGYQGSVSPNRADALVWALTTLAFNAPAPPRIETL